ncbi:PP2C family protein-serine/threonine phosphatase [Sphingomonas jatrophae]|uniref:Protein phosphatase n=1 Tax=Sphingomonas jatrophae TaxID=1166337 RepID=A0A1I6M241_9SPHN|nr:protein phosphatase 2C domain-containing protein [Sphingomonas jatrophae]SFS09765.1 protein phosphatase [Sphingomonas jatrophae]
MSGSGGGRRDLEFEAVERTHVGRVRKLNEDRVLGLTGLGLWAVADGMGGHQRGDMASTMLVDALTAIDPMNSGFAFLDSVQDTVQRVNRTLVAHARLSAPGTVIGSTIVVLLAYAGHYACLWAGDSRGYLLRNGRFDQITRDHSMVQELIDSGALNRAEASAYGRSNVITRAVGVSDRLAMDVHTGPIEGGDIFLLCSDGLTGMVDDATIAKVLTTSQSLDGAADRLIELALEHGGKDNVSVVLVRADPALDDTLQRLR